MLCRVERIQVVQRRRRVAGRRRPYTHGPCNVAVRPSQIVLSTHTVGEALFTINRPLVVEILKSRAHR